MIWSKDTQKLFGLGPSKPGTDNAASIAAADGNETKSLMKNKDGDGGGEVGSGSENTDYGSSSLRASKVAGQKEKESSSWPVQARNAVLSAISFLALAVAIHFFGPSAAAITVLFAAMLRVLIGFKNGLEDFPQKIGEFVLTWAKTQRGVHHVW